MHICSSPPWFQGLFPRWHNCSMIRICILHTWDAPATKQSSGCCTVSAREFYWENQVSVSHCFATSYPAIIREVWVTVMVQKQSHLMKGETRVQMTNKNQTLGKKSRILSQEPISCNQTFTNIVTNSARHTTVLQDSMIPLVQGPTSFSFSLADLGFTWCIITQAIVASATEWSKQEYSENSTRTPLPKDYNSSWTSSKLTQCGKHSTSFTWWKGLFLSP